MINIIEQAPRDAGTLMQFVVRAVDEVGATLNAALVVMGGRLGLYPPWPAPGTHDRRARKPVPAPLSATWSATRPRAVTAWLAFEQTVALTDPDGPAYVPGDSSAVS